MPRETRRLKCNEFTLSRYYLTKCLRDSTLVLPPRFSQDDAKREFAKVIWGFDSKMQTSLLNAWCDKFLGAEEWHRLQAAIRDQKLQGQRFRMLKSILMPVTA